VIEIPLVNGKGVALVDDIDADLALLPWYYTSGYAKWLRTHHRQGKDGQSRAFMHRIVLSRMLGPLPAGIKVDHRNRNKLDNRRRNLRPVTDGQNVLNSRRRRIAGVLTPMSRYKGVQWHEHSQLWQAKITMTLGMFATEEAAAHAYDAAAQKLFGEYAFLNFPEEGEHE
jgi:hypothetical protein